MVDEWNVCSVLVEWYWQGRTEVLGEKSVTFVSHKSHMHPWDLWAWHLLYKNPLSIVGNHDVSVHLVPKQNIRVNGADHNIDLNYLFLKITVLVLATSLAV